LHDLITRLYDIENQSNQAAAKRECKSTQQDMSKLQRDPAISSYRHMGGENLSCQLERPSPGWSSIKHDCTGNLVE
jgi:hypothetical protein